MPQVMVTTKDYDGIGSDLNSEEAFEETNKNHSSTSLNNHETFLEDPEVFVIAKSYAGLLSGCIAVDKIKF